MLDIDNYNKDYIDYLKIPFCFVFISFHIWTLEAHHQKGLKDSPKIPSIKALSVQVHEPEKDN